MTTDSSTLTEVAAMVAQEDVGLGAFTDEELSIAGSDGAVAARLAGPHYLNSLDDDTRQTALLTAVRSLAVRGLLTVKPGDADETNGVTLHGALAAVTQLREQPRSVLFVERLSQESSRSRVLYGHDAGVFLEESIEPPGGHRFTLRSLTSVIKFLAAFTIPPGVSSQDGETIRSELSEDGSVEPDPIDSLLDASDPVTRLHAIGGTSPVKSSVITVAVNDGKVWAISRDATSPLVARQVSPETLLKLFRDLLLIDRLEVAEPQVASGENEAAS